MKGIKFTLLVGGIALSLSSCVKDTLVFPEQEADNTTQEPIDVFVKPSGVNIVGDYEYKYIFQFPQFSDKLDKIRIHYLDQGEEKEVEVTDFSKNFIIATTSEEEKEFTLMGIAKDGRESAAVGVVGQNKGLYIDEIIQFVSAIGEGTDVLISWSNPLSRGLEVHLIYPTEEGQKEESITAQGTQGNLSFPGLYGDKAELQIKDSLGNVASYFVSYGIASQDVDKAAWEAEVSSNQPNDGGGAPALIDGDPNTFWHSPWSGDIPPWPHYATIALGQSRSLTGFSITNRHNNGSGAPGEFDFQVSTDGVNFETVQSYENMSTTMGEVIPYQLDSPVETTFVRLLFKTSINGHPYMALGEIALTEAVVEVY